MRSRPTLLQVKKIIGASAAIIFIAAAFGFMYLDNTFVSYPRLPSPEADRIVPYAVKGVVVYITQGQRDLLSWLNRIELAAGVVVALVVLVHRGDPFSSRK